MNNPETFRELVNHYLDIHTDMIKMLMFGIMGFLGGVVRICGHTGKWPWRRIVSSLLMSLFAGSLTGAIIHNHLSDPMYIGAVCSLGGYVGQETLVIVARFVEKKTGLNFNVGDRK